MKHLDLSKYQLAYFQWDSLSHHLLCQDDVMRLTDNRELERIELVIALIPKNKKLSSFGGDDWNDAPAECNASGFYKYPKGTIFLTGRLGGKLTVKDNL